MPHLEFVSPEGEASRNPSLDEIKRVILREGEDYWSSGAGQATLGVPEPGDGPSLTLTLAPLHGFFIEHLDANKNLFVPLVDAANDGSVVVEVGGDPIRLPLKSIVNRETAWEIVQEFYSRDKISSKVSWVSMSDFDWDFDPDDEGD